MDRLIQVERGRLAAGLHAEVGKLLAGVMDAVNAAKEGQLIQDSERPVLELMRDFQKRVYEKALQLRIDSTESAFSPSQGPRRQTQAQQGAVGSLTSDTAGVGDSLAQEVLRPRRGKPGPGGCVGGSGPAVDQSGGDGDGRSAGD